MVTVYSDAVAAPVTVRYAWADIPVANLINAEGFPAAPIRTGNDAIIPYIRTNDQ